MKCKQCGSELTDTMKFCGECGAPVKQPKPNKFCTQCGNKLHDGLLFCPQCGTKIEKHEQDVINPNTSAQKTENRALSDKYKVVFHRKSQVTAYSVYAVQIQVDQNGTTYQLKNSSSLEFVLSPGYHTFKLKMTGLALNLRTVTISLDVRGNRELNVSTIPMANNAIKPIIVKDESGTKL